MKSAFPSLGSQDWVYSTRLKLKAWYCDFSLTGTAEVSEGKHTHQSFLLKQTWTGNNEKSPLPRQSMAGHVWKNDEEAFPLSSEPCSQRCWVMFTLWSRRLNDRVVRKVQTKRSLTCTWVPHKISYNAWYELQTLVLLHADFHFLSITLVQISQ